MADEKHIVDDVVARFNERQKEAATMPLESCLVLAGAGSGKTAVLTARIGWVTQKLGVPSERVLAVTFTNKAAAEMRQRLRSLVGDESSSKMWIGTFHSLCNKILRIEHEAAGLPREFAILDTDGQERVIKTIINDMEGKGDSDDSGDSKPEKIKPATYAKAISETKEDGLGPWDVDVVGQGLPEQFSEVYAAYNVECKRQGLLDFCDLQLKVVELFRSNPEVEARYRERFKTVFVDEFQDTNDIQYEWLQRIGRTAAVMAVGDDDQSIYAFRGAKPQNMQRFLNEFAKGRRVALEQNYRSLPFVLNAANAVIKNNQGRLGKTLFTEKPSRGEVINLVSCDNEFVEARFVASQAKKLVDAGGKPSDIAVLYRTNTQSRIIESEMLKAGIPVTIYGGFRFYDRSEVKNLFAYLDLVCNIGRDISLSRIINIPPRGIGERTVETLRLQAKENKHSMLEQIAANVDEADTTGKKDKKLQAMEEFLDCVVAFAETAQNCSLEALVDKVIEDSGLADFYSPTSLKKGATKEDKEEAALRLENLFAVKDNAAQFEQDFLVAREKAGDKPPPGGWKAIHVLSDYLAEIALLTSTSEADMNKKNTASLMTVHASKGLEFATVFLIGMEDGVFPHKRSLPDEGVDDSHEAGREYYAKKNAELEEERRLMYVAITRAKNRLLMSHARRKKTPAGWESRAPSRFVNEIPKDLLRLSSVNEQKASFQNQRSGYAKKPCSV